MGRIGRVYRRIWSLVGRKPSNFTWVVPDRLAGSGRPMTKGDLEWMKKEGMGALVSLTEDPLPDEWVTSTGIKYLHNPLEDHGMPSIEEIDGALIFISRQIEAGKAVVVHCAAGQGRTGTILASYFIVEEGLSAEEAIRKVRRLRPRSIESRQEQSIQVYEKHLKHEKE
jgi:atypical dual specificity phosphatase